MWQLDCDRLMFITLPIGGGCEKTMGGAAAAGATLATLGFFSACFLPLLVAFLAPPAAAAPLAGAEEGLSLPLSSSKKSSGTVEGITGLRLLTLWS